MENLITRDNVEQAARAVRALAPGFEPEVAIVLGSGWGESLKMDEVIARRADRPACLHRLQLHPPHGRLDSSGP